MKTSIVPAQIMTVEDRIAANLSLTQMILLIIPVFFSALIFAVLPPFFKLDPLKLALAGLFALLPFGLAIRFRGEVVFKTLRTALTFWFRPRLYLLSRRPEICHCDQVVADPLEAEADKTNRGTNFQPATQPLDEAQTAELIKLLKARNISFLSNKQGKFSAIIK